MISMYKLLSSIGLLGLLTACGGGSDDSDVSSVTSVSGSFKQSAETGVYYSPDINGIYDYDNLGYYASTCRENRDSYYETDNVYVFGNPELSESDYETAANWVESYFQNALNLMGLTAEEYFAERTIARQYARELLLASLESLRNTPWLTFGDYVLPDEIQAISDSSDFNEAVYEWAVTQATNADAQDVIDTLIANDPTFDVYSSLELDNKLYVCLHENTNSYYWGEGTYAGIVIAAPSVYTPSSIDELITHELIHTIQKVFSQDATTSLRLPRWWLEGQATYVSGMGAVSKSEHDEYDPTLVVSNSDEVYSDDAYGHYPLAYQYLEEANSRETLVSFMSQLKSLVSNAYSEEYNNDLSISVEDYQFINLFNDTMVDMEGNALTVEQWRNDYHSYMNDWNN